MSIRDRYSTGSALRHALDARLAIESRTTGSRERLQRNAAYERLLARLFVGGEESPWIVKGGYALDIRMPTAARRTKDLDLSIPPQLGAADQDAAVDRFRKAITLDLDDWFTFRIVKRLELGAPDDEIGMERLTIEAAIAGSPFTTFLVDVAIEAVPPKDVEWASLPASFAFAGEAPPRVALVTSARHLAEKLHALTRPHGTRENSRVKDIVDVVLLLDRAAPPIPILREALVRVYESRSTHAMPVTFPTCPESWVAPYAAMAAETGVSLKTVREAESRARELWTLVSSG
jgi:predicted nucleotidyltransferase component of viral defense system